MAFRTPLVAPYGAEAESKTVVEESVSISGALSVSASDSAEATELASVQAAATTSVAERIELSDSISLSSTGSISAAESRLVLSESASISSSASFSADEGGSVGDALGFSSIASQSATDDAQITEASSVKANLSSSVLGEDYLGSETASINGDANLKLSDEASFDIDFELRLSKSRNILDSTTIDSNANVEGISFSPDGTKLYAAITSPERIVQLDLSTPWDITSGDYNGVYFEDFEGLSGLRDVVIRAGFEEGMFVYVNDYIIEYNFNDGSYDVSTATYANDYQLNTLNKGFGVGLDAARDGGSLYVTGYNINDSTKEGYNQLLLDLDWTFGSGEAGVSNGGFTRLNSDNNTVFDIDFVNSNTLYYVAGDTEVYKFADGVEEGQDATNLSSPETLYFEKGQNRLFVGDTGGEIKEFRVPETGVFEGASFSSEGNVSAFENYEYTDTVDRITSTASFKADDRFTIVDSAAISATSNVSSLEERTVGLETSSPSGQVSVDAQRETTLTTDSATVEGISSINQIDEKITVTEASSIPSSALYSTAEGATAEESGIVSSSALVEAQLDGSTSVSASVSGLASFESEESGASEDAASVESVASTFESPITTLAGEGANPTAQAQISPAESSSTTVSTQTIQTTTSFEFSEIGIIGDSISIPAVGFIQSFNRRFEIVSIPASTDTQATETAEAKELPSIEVATTIEINDLAISVETFSFDSQGSVELKDERPPLEDSIAISTASLVDLQSSSLAKEAPSLKITPTTTLRPETSLATETPTVPTNANITSTEIRPPITEEAIIESSINFTLAEFRARRSERLFDSENQAILQDRGNSVREI